MSHNVKVVVLGRGTGESILVEYEENSWLVIDSFRHPKSNAPIAAWYLQSIGLKPYEVVKKIIITHFHQDHISGMKDLIERCDPTTPVYISQALTADEAIKYYITLDEAQSGDKVSGVSEITKILTYLHTNSRRPHPLKQDETIFRNSDIDLIALSPSNYDIQEANLKFAKLLHETDKDAAPMAPRENPNNYCVVINLDLKNVGKSAIFGADLETNTHPESGWNSVSTSVLSPTNGTVNFFKISHHGSITGYHQNFWSSKVELDALSVITTFEKSKSPLPTRACVQMYKQHTNKLFCTTEPKYLKADKVLPTKAAKIAQKKSPNVVVKPLDLNLGYVLAEQTSSSFEHVLYGSATQL